MFVDRKMVCLEIYSKYETIKYKSTLCSKTTFFVILTKLASVILPLIFAYNSKGFWIKRDVFHEQPEIKCKYEYIFIAETDDLTSPILCSNIINFKDRIINYEYEKCSTIKIREIDYNHDGKNDELYFNLVVKESETLNIQSVTLILPLDYKIQTCPMQMQTAAIIQYFYINAGAQMNFIGDISLTQNSPLPCYPKGTFTEFNVTLIDNNFELWDFLEKHFRRSISTKIDHSYITWLAGSMSSFSLDIRIRYSEQMVYYKPNFWQVMKFAWIQYLAVFVAVRWLINYVENYVFTNKLVLFYVDKSHEKLR